MTFRFSIAATAVIVTLVSLLFESSAPPEAAPVKVTELVDVSHWR